MPRILLSIIFGVIICLCSLVIFGMIAGILYPLPADFNHSDPKVLQVYLESLPSGMYAVIILGWVVGSFFAGFAASFTAKTKNLAPPVIIGAIMTALTAYSLYSGSRPLWVVVISFIVFIPITVLGFLIAGRTQR